MSQSPMSQSTEQVLINGQIIESVAFTDRGLQYGDGLFETLACVEGRLQGWHLHMQRLSLGCQRLGLTPFSEQQWLADIAQLEIPRRAVIKLLLSRGSGGRGYRAADNMSHTRIVACYPWPDYPASFSDQGVRVRWCQTPVSVNRRLAGIKHLNRLDNVLARNEWQDPDIHEGLMLDDQGYVIEGTMSNVFAVKDQVLYTPQLTKAGVEGIIKQSVFQLAEKNHIPLRQVDITQQQLLEMDEVFLTNSLIGLWPVRQLEDKVFNRGPITDMLMAQLDLDNDAHEL